MENLLLAAGLSPQSLPLCLVEQRRRRTVLLLSMRSFMDISDSSSLNIDSKIMKGTEVLTLGAVGVINLYTRAKVYILLSCYMSSWAGYISRLAIVAPCHPVHILMSERCI